MIDGSATNRGMVAYLVRNGTDTAVNVGFFVPTPTAATYVAERWDSSSGLGAISPAYTQTCANATNGKFRIDSPTAITCNGSGWNAPTLNSGVCITGTSPTGECIIPSFTGALVGDIKMWNLSGTSSTPRCSGCLTSYSTGGLPYSYYEFTVDKRGGPTSPTERYVVLYADTLYEISPTFPVAGVAEVNLVGGVGGTRYTGEILEDWGWCHSASGMPFICITGQQERMRHYRALAWAKLHAQDLRAAVRTRPATTATPHTQTALPDTTASPLNFESWDWRVCEGTWTSTSPSATCTIAFPPTTAL